MSQNLISLKLTDADYAEIDQTLNQLEARLSGLIDLDRDQRRSLMKMGDKSEAFCRETLLMLEQNPKLVPASLDLADANRDMASLDALRPRAARLRQLMGRLEDTETALGSDVMSAALEGYALLKVLGKGSGLEALRKEMSARFARAPQSRKREVPAG